MINCIYLFFLEPPTVPPMTLFFSLLLHRSPKALVKTIVRLRSLDRYTITDRQARFIRYFIVIVIVINLLV